MKKSVLILLISLSSCFAFSQTTKEDVLKDEEFIKLKKESIAYYTSDKYINYKKRDKEFKDKLPKEYYYYPDNPSNFENWLKDNIESTEFNSIEEALELYKQKVDDFMNHMDDDAEIKTLISKLEERYGRDAFNKIFGDYVFVEFYKVWQENGIK